MKLEIYGLTEEEERAMLQNQFTQMLTIFARELYSGEMPEVCRITYEAFGNLEDAHHNCIGCNLLESADLIHQYLQMNQNPFSLRQAYTTYIMLAYLLVERLDTLLDLIKLPDFYRENHFKVLSRIRRWANFIKHPKAFVLVHHPVYTFVNSPNIKGLAENANVKIDDTFIATYYLDNKKDDDLIEKLANKEDVLVVFPDAVKLTEEFCMAIKEFINLLRDNSVYREMLNQKSTFLNYWVSMQQSDAAQHRVGVS